jgi:tetratricopeptide (TPR) repeat protein
LGKHDEAIRYYDKAIKIKPNNALALNNKGNALVKLAKFEDAIKCYDKALKINPNHDLARDNKTTFLSYLNKQRKKKG